MKGITAEELSERKRAEKKKENEGERQFRDKRKKQ